MYYVIKHNRQNSSVGYKKCPFFIIINKIFYDCYNLFYIKIVRCTVFITCMSFVFGNF